MDPADGQTPGLLGRLSPLPGAGLRGFGVSHGRVHDPDRVLLVIWQVPDPATVADLDLVVEGLHDPGV